MASLLSSEPATPLRGPAHPLFVGREGFASRHACASAGPAPTGPATRSLTDQSPATSPASTVYRRSSRGAGRPSKPRRTSSARSRSSHGTRRSDPGKDLMSPSFSQGGSCMSSSFVVTGKDSPPSRSPVSRPVLSQQGRPPCPFPRPSITCLRSSPA